MNLGTPVFAMSSDTESVLLTGYDANNVYLFQPQAGSSGQMGISDAAKMFADAGNVFFGYTID